MDSSWISDPKSSESYKKGVEEFLNFVSKNALKNGKMNCPCTRCRNLTCLKRGTVRKHLLKHGFNKSAYERWVCPDEIDPNIGCSNSTEKNDDAVDRGNASKSTVEDLDVLPNHDKTVAVKDPGSDRQEILFLKKVQGFAPDDLNTELIARMANLKDDDLMIMSFAIYLNKWRRKFEWDMEQFEELMTYLVDVFPRFHQLRARFNFTWNTSRLKDIKSSNTQSDDPRSMEDVNKKATDELFYKCYACGQDIKTDDGASTSSTRRNNKKKKKKNQRKNYAQQ